MIQIEITILVTKHSIAFFWEPIRKFCSHHTLGTYLPWVGLLVCEATSTETLSWPSTSVSCCTMEHFCSSSVTWPPRIRTFRGVKRRAPRRTTTGPRTSSFKPESCNKREKSHGIFLKLIFTLKPLDAMDFRTKAGIITTQQLTTCNATNESQCFNVQHTKGLFKWE